MATSMNASDGDGKRKIKKLTKEKLEQFHDEIVRPRGQVDLSGRGIEAIVSLDGLRAATKIDLSHNALTKLSELKRVPNTTMLKLTGNKLNGEGLAEIQHLKKLVVLNAAENHVSRIPVEVLRNLRSLKALVLNDNSITTLDWIPKLPELNSLVVSNNRISQIPTQLLAKLPNLTKISISHNQLEDLPDLSSLQHLTELRLSNNKFKKIPFHLAKLENLRLLELTHNEIDDWKGIEALQSLKNLKQLSLRGNPIVGQPIDISLNKTESQEGSDSEDENGADAKTKLKEAKLLDAKNKQYNFKMKRLFPKLVVRDGQRVMDKKTHGYVAPPKEEKEVEKPKRKHTHTHKAKAKKSVEAGEAEHKSKHTKSHKRKRDDDANAAADDGAETPKVASPVKPVKKEVKETADKEQRQIKKSTSKTDTASGSAVIKNKVAAEGDDEAAKRKKEKNKARKETAKQKKATKDEKSAKRQPKDIASGVIAVKQFKKAKKENNSVIKAEPVNVAAANFTPNVGMGGASAWD